MAIETFIWVPDDEADVDGTCARARRNSAMGMRRSRATASMARAKAGR